MKLTFPAKRPSFISNPVYQKSGPSDYYTFPAMWPSFVSIPVNQKSGPSDYYYISSHVTKLCFDPCVPEEWP